MARTKINRTNAGKVPSLAKVKKSEHLNFDHDLLTEEIINDARNSPIGKLLQQIAALPEIRQDKVLYAKREIAEGRYDTSDRLDATVDSILEELLA